MTNRCSAHYNTTNFTNNKKTLEHLVACSSIFDGYVQQDLIKKKPFNACLFETVWQVNKNTCRQFIVTETEAFVIRPEG